MSTIPSTSPGRLPHDPAAGTPPRPGDRHRRQSRKGKRPPKDRFARPGKLILTRDEAHPAVHVRIGGRLVAVVALAGVKGKEVKLAFSGPESTVFLRAEIDAPGAMEGRR